MAKEKMPPLFRLWQYAAGHRRKMVWAAVCTTINKFADVGPELLIGAAVDVIVRGDRSFVAGLFGVEDRFSGLYAALWRVQTGDVVPSHPL